jgi:quercetin dioxygenase-like cupin family protein
LTERQTGDLADASRIVGRHSRPMQITTRTTTTREPLWFLHNLAVIHARSDQTAGSYAIVELTGAPGDAPPLHVHTHADEGFYVLEGRLRLYVGADVVLRLQPGEFALAARGIPHTYVVESDQPARWLAISSGGFERFVEEVSAPARHPAPPDEPQLPPEDELVRAAARHGIVILGPPGQLPH